MNCGDIEFITRYGNSFTIDVKTCSVVWLEANVKNDECGDHTKKDDLHSKVNG